ncbi:E3 ubiquitin-protein ligase TRAIP [Amyelois transitella]|uniref:E3 ubiquitin-protein ligase TRAIP n=1 Tax=Amyelois transitella TaxID=680683 RepID=UPI00067C65B4|nr:E3 ubiquitin-protein ligase TRAIP [Amyelois transitella]
MHILCTICSDLVNPAENLHATKCGHLFHYRCLSQWIERSASCPQCRNKVTDRCMFRVYPTVSNENSGDDVTTLQSKLDDALLQLRQQKVKEKEKEDKLAEIGADLKKNVELLKTYEKKLVSRDSAVVALREQLEYIKLQNKETKRIKDENTSLKKNLQTLNGLQKVLNATSDEVEQMLQGYTDVRTVATFATALKRALCESEARKNELRERLHSATQNCNAEISKVRSLQTKLAQLEEKLIHAELNASELKKQYESNNKRKTEDNVIQTDMEQALESNRDEKKSPDVCKDHPKRQSEFNKAMYVSHSDKSFDRMVKTIEDSDSPYLCLKQSSLALTVLQQRPKQMAADNKLKPSELALLNSVRNIAMKKPAQEPSTSIFQKKPKLLSLAMEHEPNLDDAQMDITYDGLGGHSKPDIFPTPTKRPLKSCVPKLSAKHKLKRPTPNGSQDISKMLAKMQDK